MPEVISFAEALALTHVAGGKAHVLLGNGFSIALRPDSFRYGALLDEATFDGLSVDSGKLFELFQTFDFELIVEHLQAAGQLTAFYQSDPDLGARMSADAEVVKSALAQVLASRHPGEPGLIAPAEYLSCRRFLSNFARIYSLNYDLLVYWTTMQDEGPSLPTDDGFRADPGDYEAPYVVWDPQSTFSNQSVYYLHGALHLFDSGQELRKVTYSRTHARLVDQIRGRLDEGSYPLVVTEGHSEQKLEKILHSAYLNHARRSFGAITGSLFVHGLSFSPNDEHITGLLSRPTSKIDRMFVSLHGDPETPANRAVVQAAERIAEKRAQHSKARPLDVRFYSSESAAVWTHVEQ